MDNDTSLLNQLGQIARQIRGILNTTDADVSDTSIRKVVQAVSKNLEIARKFLHDYESEEDARKQATILPQGIERLENLRKNILDASQYNIFGPVDVAQISANLDQLIERLR